MQASRMKAGGRGRRCSHGERFQREAGYQAIRRVTGKRSSREKVPLFGGAENQKGQRHAVTSKRGDNSKELVAGL